MAMKSYDSSPMAVITASRSTSPDPPDRVATSHAMPSGSSSPAAYPWKFNCRAMSFPYAPVFFAWIVTTPSDASAVTGKSVLALIPAVTAFATAAASEEFGILIATQSAPM